MDPQRECDQCSPSCSPSCDQTSCLLTAECTDQCLVLTCNDPDPDHASQSCLVADGPASCDGTCVAAEPCNACTGLDEIFQCCTDYRTYCAHSRPYDSPPFVSWEDSFPDLPCECTQDPQSTYPPTSVSQSIQTLISDSSISSSASSSPSLPPFSPHLHVSSPLALQSTSAPSFPCMWANCGSVFNSLSDLVGHVNIQHLRAADAQSHTSLPIQPHPHVFSNPPLSCHWGDCAIFPSPSSIPSSSSATSDDDVLNILATHLMQDHLGVSYPLPLSTTLQPSADLHDTFGTVPQPTLSPNSPPHDCSGTHICKWKACTQSFPSCDDLTAHIASVHIGGGKSHYECLWQDCSRHGTNGFSSKQKISRHLQSHTGHRPFQCHVCNQNFSEAATLQQHMRRHTRERPYVCDFPGCGKAFAIAGALTIHKRTHNGLRPFKCKFCDKAFSESSNLSKHLRTHTGARPYECTEKGCKKAFARPDQLARHMNVHRKKNSGVDL